MALNESTNKQIEAEIRRVVGELASHHSWRVSQYLQIQIGQEIILKDEMDAPFALTLRELFDHAYGDRQVEWIADTCQSICEALYCRHHTRRIAGLARIRPTDAFRPKGRNRRVPLPRRGRASGKQEIQELTPPLPAPMVRVAGVRESVPQRGRERAPALGSAGVRAVERAAGVETGEGCLLPSARPAPVLATPNGDYFPHKSPQLVSAISVSQGSSNKPLLKRLFIV